MSDYNYVRFDEYVESGAEEVEFAAFADHLHAGEQAPDATLTRLSDGVEVTLAELWKRQNVVVEFGSFT